MNRDNTRNLSVQHTSARFAHEAEPARAGLMDIILASCCPDHTDGQAPAGNHRNSSRYSDPLVVCLKAHTCVGTCVNSHTLVNTFSTCPSLQSWDRGSRQGLYGQERPEARCCLKVTERESGHVL